MILYWKHLSLFSIVTLKGSWYMASGDKFFPTSSSSIFGDLRTFKTKCSRAILAVTLEGVRLSLTALLEGICGEFKREYLLLQLLRSYWRELCTLVSHGLVCICCYSCYEVTGRNSVH